MYIAVFSPHPHKARLILQYLRAYQTSFFTSADTVNTLTQRPALYIVDLSFVQDEWRAIMQHAAQQHTPVLLIASPKQTDMLAEALQSTHTDFVLNPVTRTDLTTRITVLLRRYMPDYALARLVTIEEYVFDAQTHTVHFHDESVLLTQKELMIAQLLLTHLQQPLSRASIHDIVWGKDSEVPGRTIDTHVSRVRNKLRFVPENGYQLSSIYSFGYQLEKTAK